MSEQLLSQKYANYNYAPGIATYGIDGKTGQTGNDGNNIYFTDYTINDESEILELLQKISKNYLPIKGSDTEINRPYKAGDIFFDRNGVIYKLLNANIDNVTQADWRDYFTIVGKIHVTDDNNFFTFAPGSNRLILNAGYTGYDICSNVNANDASQYINRDAAVNIISSNVDENNNIEIVRMQSIDDIDIEDGKLTVLYKTTENAFYVDSNKPVVINGDLKVESNNNIDNEYDEFSTVLTSDDPITYFKYLCDKLKYSVIYDDQTNQYYISIYQEDGRKDALEYLLSRKETVFGKIYTAENEQALMKLSNVIYGNINSSMYNDYLPAYNILDLQRQITRSSFNIHFINVNDSSIYVNVTENSNNKSLSIDVSLNANFLDAIAKGTASSSKTFSDVIGSNVIYDEQSKNQNAPYGIATGNTMDRNKYIEIAPIDKIYAGDTLDISMYTTTYDSRLYAQIWIDGKIENTDQISNPNVSSETSQNKSIYSLQYIFTEDVHRDTIRIGYPNKDFRLHKYVINANSEKHANHLPSDENYSMATYEKELLNEAFGVKLSYIKNDEDFYTFVNGNIEEDTSKISEFSLTYNKNGRYKFTFNTDNIKIINGEKTILMSLIPCMDYNGGIPVQLAFKISEELNGSYTLYFTILHSETKFRVLDIMLDNANGVQIYSDEQRYCIQSYIPSNVNSVVKFALLYNTEVFLDYWNEMPIDITDTEYNDQGVIKSEGQHSYIYRLTSYNAYDYNKTGQLIPNDDKYYQYSGETIMWDGQLCYVWDRYEYGNYKSSSISRSYECKILTNTLDIALPLTIDSPEFVATLDGNDTDEKYDGIYTLRAADESYETEDNYQEEYTRLLPNQFKGLRILQK